MPPSTEFPKQQQQAKRVLSRTDIHAIFQQYVIPYAQQDAQRYVDFSPWLKKYNNRRWQWEGKDFPRVIALLEFMRYVEKHQLRASELLTTYLDPEMEYLPCDQVTVVEYDPNTQANDLHVLDLQQRNFDFVLLNQTIEHLYDPILCLRNLYDHLSPGGYLYANVPANNIPHSTPEHYYTGVTPVGLGAMTRAAGFEIVELGFWGNRKYLQLLFDTHSWPDYRQLPHPLANEPENPVISWVLARKV